MTRQDVIDKAISCRNLRFRHQGRSRETGIDCMGLLYVILTELGVKGIVDVEGYRRNPSASVIRETMDANFDEIELDNVQAGDIYLMRMRGAKPKHAAVLLSTDTDLVRGVQPRLIHAYAIGGQGKVVIEPVSQWRDSIVAAYKIREIK